jgi:O-antigen/teichoic acid export membrane protein
MTFSGLRSKMSDAVARFADLPALRDATALGLGTLLSQVILLIATPVFLRLYEPADFGLYAFAYSSVVLIATVGTWKIERLIVIVPERSTAIRLLAALVWIAAGAAVLFLALVPLIVAVAGKFVPELHKGPPLIWLAPVSMLVLVASTGIRFYAIRTGKFSAVATGQVSRTIVFSAGVIATALYWHGLAGPGALIMLAWQIGADFCALLIQVQANRPTLRLIMKRPRLRASLAVLRTRRKTMGVLAASVVIGALNYQIPISTVMLVFGPASAGWYFLANTLVFAPCNVIASAVSEVSNQRLSRYHAAHKPYSQILLRTTLAMVAGGIIPFTALFVLAPVLLPRIMGPQWLGATQSVMVLAVASYFNFVGSPGGNIALIVDARRYMLSWYVSRLVIAVMLAIAAALGLMSYSTWLASKVATDSVAFLSEGVSGYIFARLSEARWRENRCN